MATPIDNTKVVYQGQPATAVGLLYTADPTKNGDMIKEIICTNVTNAAANITLYKVPNGGTAGITNAIVYKKSVPPYDFIVLALTTDMAPGDFISGMNDTLNAVTVTITNYQK